MSECSGTEAVRRGIVYFIGMVDGKAVLFQQGWLPDLCTASFENGTTFVFTNIPSGKDVGAVEEVDIIQSSGGLVCRFMQGQLALARLANQGIEVRLGTLAEHRHLLERVDAGV